MYKNLTLCLAALVLAACSGTGTPQIIENQVDVTREVEVTRQVEVEVTREIEVTREVEVTRLVVATVEATNTPAPTATSQFGSFDAPVTMGTGHTFQGFGTLTVDENQWLPGQTGFAVLHLSFACERPAGQECDTSDFFFDVIGTSGNGYEQKFDSTIPQPSFGSIFSDPVFGGGTQAGYIGFLITNAEDWLILRVGKFLEDDEIYFATN